MTSGEGIRRGGRPGAHKGDRARAERLENLRRRKSQAKGQPPAGGEAAPHDSAGFVPDKSKE
jgi:hypothetical protein